MEINFDGNNAIFKVGEGENNHYQIVNDKKLWENQFMIVNKGNQFYIRDLGVVHTSRIKVDAQFEIQLQSGSLIDLGKVVHYHFHKATFSQKPEKESNQEFIVMRNNQEYNIDSDPVLRGRPTWISSDENKDLVQNEIFIENTPEQSEFTLGRSNKRDIEIKLKAVSADHCAIYYSPSKGWVISEKGKQRLSSNGTFVFMKSNRQIDDHEPSDLIPLYNGMVISFINYELQIFIEQKSESEVQ